MQYHKFIVGDTIIEFHNNWLGEETVIANGKIVSKASSLLGMNHHFSILEKGTLSRYVLTTKATMLHVALDLRKNGVVLYEDAIVTLGSKPKMPKNKLKSIGIAKLNEFDLMEATHSLEKALNLDPGDPEIHFHLACAYSLQERALEGFTALKNAITYNLGDTEMILNHEMLAFLRIHEAFESFLDSGFTQIEEKLFE